MTCNVKTINKKTEGLNQYALLDGEAAEVLTVLGGGGGGGGASRMQPIWIQPLVDAPSVDAPPPVCCSMPHGIVFEYCVCGCTPTSHCEQNDRRV